VARGATLDAVRANGITAQSPLGTRTATVEASDDPATLGVQDAILVTVKAPALPAIATGLQPLMGPATDVVFVVNGIPWWYLQGEHGPLTGRTLPRLDPGDVLRKTVGIDRSIGGVIFGGCDVVSPGVVHVENAKMRFILGHPDGRRSERLDALAACLRGDDLNVEITDHIRRGVWTKLQMVVCSGLIGCRQRARRHRRRARLCHRDHAGRGAQRRAAADASSELRAGPGERQPQYGI
jgi:2-dehydropantoate 2-reductase